MHVLIVGFDMTKHIILHGMNNIKISFYQKVIFYYKIHSHWKFLHGVLRRLKNLKINGEKLAKMCKKNKGFL